MYFLLAEIESTDALYKVSNTIIEHLGLVIVQVSQNQAAVVSGPGNKIFVVKDGGFVATANEGHYEVLSIVDHVHLQNPVKDRVTGLTLGWTQEVKVKTPGRAGEKDQEHVVAILCVCSYLGVRYIQTTWTV